MRQQEEADENVVYVILAGDSTINAKDGKSFSPLAACPELLSGKTIRVINAAEGGTKMADIVKLLREEKAKLKADLAQAQEEAF